jgi:2-amino-4-hydroxy-6-hydroxymethyldihydropteridine diphosphokinase
MTTKVTQTIAIALGTNLGDRELHLEEAITALKEDIFIDGTAKVSRTYESPPWGYANQPEFLNLVVVGRRDWKPHALLNYFREYETTMGRKRDIPNGPRVIDLDLIAYGAETLKDPQIEVPHPRFRDRDFVLLPLCDVWGEWKDPITGKTALVLLSELEKKQPFSAKPLTHP